MAFTGPFRCSRITVAKVRTRRLVQNGSRTMNTSQRRSRAEPVAMAWAIGNPSSTQIGVTMALIAIVFHSTCR